MSLFAFQVLTGETPVITYIGLLCARRIFLQEANRLLQELATLPPLLALLASMSFAQTIPSPQATPTPASPTPAPYKQLRYEEDWSSLADPSRRHEALDRIKFIPLNERGDWYLSIGGEARGKSESFRNSSFGQKQQDNVSYLLQRYMLHFDLHMGSRVRAFFQIKSNLENGRKGGRGPVDEDKLDLHQAFVDIALSFGAKRTLVLRLGRQEMLFGSARLVAPRDGPNVRLSFDGLRAVVRAGAWRIDTFITKPVETNSGLFDDAPDHNQTFWGAYAVRPLKLLPYGNIDLYYLGIDRKEARFDQGAARETRHSVGMRLWGKMKAWDYNSEMIVQLGNFGHGKVRAWAAASDVGYTLRTTRFRPRLGLKADIASGDRDSTALNLQTFNTLFPRGQYFGEIGLIGLANLVDLHPSLDLHLTDRFMVAGDWDVFWRESVRDGIYGNATNLLRSGRANRARYVGSQPSLGMEWAANPHITFNANYTHFFAGDFLKGKNPARNLNYLMLQMTYKF